MLPHSDQPPISGILRYLPEQGISLDLTGSPVASPNHWPDHNQRPFTLWGFLATGALVSLFDCHVVQHQLFAPSNGLQITQVSCSVALFGAHIQSRLTPFIVRVGTYFSSILAWLCESVGKHHFEPTTGRTAEFVFPQDTPIVIPIAENGIVYKIGVDKSFTISSAELSGRARASTSLEFCSPLSINQALTELWRVQSLLSVLVGQYVTIQSMRLYAAQPTVAMISELAYAIYKNRNTNIGNAESDWYKANSLLNEQYTNATRGDACELVFVQRSRAHSRELQSPEIMLPYPLIREQLAEVVRRWMTKSSQQSLAVDTVFDFLLSTATGVGDRLLAIAQAAESYHRSLGMGIYMNQQQYDKEIKLVNASIPQTFDVSLRESLKNKIKYGNEFSLRKRLQNIFARVPVEVAEKICKDRDWFISRFVHTRNYFTHCDHESEKQSLGVLDAHIASERVLWLVMANILLDLGVPPGSLLAILQRSSKFNHWVNYPFSENV